MPVFRFTPPRVTGSSRTRMVRKVRSGESDDPKEEVPVKRTDYPFEAGQRVFHRFRGEGVVTHPRPDPGVSFVEVKFDTGNKHLCFPESLYPV